MMNIDASFSSRSNARTADVPLNRPHQTRHDQSVADDARICASEMPERLSHNAYLSTALPVKGKSTSVWHCGACPPSPSNIVPAQVNQDSASAAIVPDGVFDWLAESGARADTGETAALTVEQSEESVKEVVMLSESEDDMWDQSPKDVATLLLTDVEADTSDASDSSCESFRDTAVTVCETAAEERAWLVKHLRADRERRFPNASQTTMDDVRAAMASLPTYEQVAAELAAGASPSPLPHPFLDLRDQHMRASTDRWQRQSAQQQQQQRAQGLSRMDAYISCKMLVGAAHAHHVAWLRRQHLHGAGLSDEELHLLQDSISYEWARLGQQVEEHLMFTDCSVVLRRLSCACIFDPDSDVRQYADAEDSRVRRIARQRDVLAQLATQTELGHNSLFIQS